MPTNDSFLKKITKIIFGNTIANTPKQKIRHKRVIGFESLENRDYLSVGPLLYELHSFQSSVSAYFDNNSNNESNETVIEYSDTELINNSDDNLYGEFFEDTDVTANLTDTEWHNITTTSTESDEECDFGGTVSASSETSETDERLGGVVIDISRADDNPYHVASVTVTFTITGTATPGVDYSVSGLTYNDEKDRYEGEITIPDYVTSTTYTIGILNDAITESSETVIFTLISVSNSDYEIDSGDVTVTIVDDDDWEITGSGGDSIWERAPYDDLPFGEFVVTRDGGLDRTYGITTEFVLSGSATPVSDYHLSWTNANDYETVISVYQDDNDIWKGSVYFPANSTDDEITIYVIPNNDAKPEDDETVTITVVNAYANSAYPFSASGSGEFTIQDDDNWTISSSVTDSIALEPCTWIPGNERTGAFEIAKSGGQDWTYSIIVKFEMSGTATPRNVGQSADYHLTTNPNGGVTADMVTVSLQNDQWIGSIVLAAAQESITLYVMPDGDYIFEDDETVILTIIDAYAVSGFSFNISNSGDDVTIWQAPEFISDADKNNDPYDSIPINGDTYYGYISRNAESGKKINTLVPINAENNRGVVYSIVSGNEEGLFAIDSGSGEITTAISLKEQASLAASYSLQIKAKDPDSDQYDLATVPITLTQWQVSRNGASKAPATSMIGCTINELADEIGLQQDEFKKWLTFTTDTVTLIDGTIISASALDFSDILAGGQQFQIPNTIHAGWFGDWSIIGQTVVSWYEDMEGLQRLGFYVHEFNNDTFTNTIDAETAYKNGLFQLWESQCLHGIYVMGHGNNNAFGSNGPTILGGIIGHGPYTEIKYSDLREHLTPDNYGTYDYYHLGAVIFEVCYGNNASFLKSEIAIFYGPSGQYVPFFEERLATRWGHSFEEFTQEEIDDYYNLYGEYPIGIEIIGGAQKTKIFEDIIC